MRDLGVGHHRREVLQHGALTRRQRLDEHRQLARVEVVHELGRVRRLPSCHEYRSTMPPRSAAFARNGARRSAGAARSRPSWRYDNARVWLPSRSAAIAARVSASIRVRRLSRTAALRRERGRALPTPARRAPWRGARGPRRPSTRGRPFRDPRSRPARSARADRTSARRPAPRPTGRLDERRATGSRSRCAEPHRVRREATTTAPTAGLAPCSAVRVARRTARERGAACRRPGPGRRAAECPVARCRTSRGDRGSTRSAPAAMSHLVDDPRRRVADRAPTRRRAAPAAAPSSSSESSRSSASRRRATACKRRGMRSDVGVQQRPARRQRARVGSERTAVEHVEEQPGRPEPLVAPGSRRRSPGVAQRIEPAAPHERACAGRAPRSRWRPR